MMSERVFVLGAGFSRAISPEMPVMTELSRAVRKYLVKIDRPLPASVTGFGDDLERWLSFLAERQPWLDESTNLHNRASFADVSIAIAEVLGERQIAAVRAPEPPWLSSLVSYWRRMGSIVVTFNYDVLVEAAVLGQIGDGHAWGELYPAPVVPAASRTGAVLWGGPPATGFRILKLHGSLTWFWSGLDAGPNDPIYDIGLRGGWSVDGLESYYAAQLPTLVIDKVAMAVPPTATKSRFYDNSTLRSLWVQAGNALRSASELVLIGYSLPPADTVVRSLLSTTFVGDVIIPVDTSRMVVDNLRTLFDPSSVVDSYAGSAAAIEEFVRTTCA